MHPRTTSNNVDDDDKNNTKVLLVVVVATLWQFFSSAARANTKTSPKVVVFYTLGSGSYNPPKAVLFTTFLSLLI